MNRWTTVFTAVGLLLWTVVLSLVQVCVATGSSVLLLASLERERALATPLQGVGVAGNGPPLPGEPRGSGP